MHSLEKQLISSIAMRLNLSFSIWPITQSISRMTRRQQNYLDRVSYITDPNRKRYAAMTVALDHGVGQVLAVLQANNLLENTLVVFLSDNGAPSDVAYDGMHSNNYPLRGYKQKMSWKEGFASLLLSSGRGSCR